MPDIISKIRIVKMFKNIACFSLSEENPVISLWLLFEGDELVIFVFESHICCHIWVFFPRAFKGCLILVFTYGVQLSGRSGWRVGIRLEMLCPGCISETIMCRMLILSTDIG